MIFRQSTSVFKWQNSLLALDYIPFLFMPTTAADDPELGRLASSLEKTSVNETSVSASGFELTFSATLDDAENLEQLGPVIKHITQTGKQTVFLDALDALIRKKDGEIERMCNSHYQVTCSFLLDFIFICTYFFFIGGLHRNLSMLWTNF